MLSFVRSLVAIFHSFAVKKLKRQNISNHIVLQIYGKVSVPSNINTVTVFIAINKNVNHFYLSFSYFLPKLVNGNQFSSAGMAEIRSGWHRVEF